MQVGGYVFFAFLWFAMACLGALVAMRGRHSFVHREFGFFSLFILIWMASNFFENDPNLSASLRSLLLDIDFATALISGYWFFVFSRDFPRERTNRHGDILWFLPAMVFVVFSFTTLIAARIRINDGSLNFDPGALFLVYGLMLFSYFFVGLWNLAVKFRHSKDVERRQILFVLAGFAASVTIGLAMNLLFQNLVPAEVFRLGVYGASFTVFGTGYAIIKHHLFSVKILAAEAAAFLLSAVLLTQMFSATSFGDLVLRFTLFIVVFALCIIFVRSIISEVRRREEIQRLAEDLRLANTKLQELSDMKSNFVSIASHQLRAPIGGVRGYLSMLREGDFGKLGKKVDDVMDLNLDTLGHTLHVIETFLNVTRIEAGKMDLNKVPVDLCAMTREIYKELALTASRKKIRLVFSCPQKIAVVRADKEKLRNVVYNLVENALKYTEQGTIKTIVNVGSKRVEMRVVDTGIGIAPEEVPKLFAKFVRADGGLKISHGSGLGLYIAKTLIEAHGGEVFVESPGMGKGSTFGFRMSASKAR